MAVEPIFESYGNKLIGVPNNEESGGSGGHVIENSSGTDLPQEDTLQFTDSHVTDDSTNGKTVVETFKAVTEAEYSSETEDGAYIITDGDGAVIGPVSDDYVEVTADGEKTIRTLLDEIYNDSKFDINKITDNAILILKGQSIKNIYRFVRIENSSDYVFTSQRIYAGTEVVATAFLKSSNSSYFEEVNQSVTDYSTTYSPVNGYKLTLYYGNKKATVDLQTTANRCLMSDGSTVQESLDSISNPSRASVSVLTYAASLSEGIHFYTTVNGTADNPISYGSFMFMIFRASTGITIFGMPLAAIDAYINASNNSGSTWSGWKSFTFS